MQPHDDYVRGAARDIAARSVGRREAELDARALAISVSEARHIQASERPGGLTRTHCGGGRRCGASDLVAAVARTPAARRASASPG